MRHEGKRLRDGRNRIKGIDAANSFLDFWSDNDHGWRQSSEYLVDEEDLRPYEDFFFLDNPRFGGFFSGREDCDLVPDYLFEDEYYISKQRPQIKRCKLGKVEADADADPDSESYAEEEVKI